MWKGLWKESYKYLKLLEWKQMTWCCLARLQFADIKQGAHLVHFCACVGIQCILLCMPWWSCMSIPNMHKWHAYCMLWICPYMVCSLVFVAGCCAPCLLAARVPTWPIAWMWCFIWPVLKHGPRSLIHVQICGLLFGVQWKWQLGCVHW